MLKRILQTLLLCCAAIVLTAKVAMSSPLPSRIFMAEHPPAHLAATFPGTNQPASPQAGKPSPAPGDSAGMRRRNRDPQQKDPPVTQADPSVPYDPYDYDAIRESNRQTYGEVKGKEPE